MAGFKKILVVFLSIFVISLVGCQSEKSPKLIVGSLQPTNPDEASIYQILDNIKSYISSSQWDKWLAMYSDDAVLTAGDKNVSKSEMREMVEGITYVISSMEIVRKDIGESSASVSVQMKANDKMQKETYTFEKRDGQWLIVAETNP